MSRYEIESDVTGVVLRLETVVGARVEAGEPLLLLESMKMEIPVAAPVTGTLVNFQVSVGDAVDEGQILASFVAEPAK